PPHVATLSSSASTVKTQPQASCQHQVLSPATKNQLVLASASTPVCAWARSAAVSATPCCASCMAGAKRVKKHLLVRVVRFPSTRSKACLRLFLSTRQLPQTLRSLVMARASISTPSGLKKSGRTKYLRTSTQLKLPKNLTSCQHRSTLLKWTVVASKSLCLATWLLVAVQLHVRSRGSAAALVPRPLSPVTA